MQTRGNFQTLQLNPLALGRETSNIMDLADEAWWFPQTPLFIYEGGSAPTICLALQSRKGRWQTNIGMQGLH